MTITDERAPDTAALLKTWVRGWAASRGCAPPIACGEGWRVEVGLPEQLRRHVFPRDCAMLRELGETIDERWVFLKACLSADELRAILPPRWTVHPPSYFMVFDGLPPSVPALAPGYALTLAVEAGVHVARVHAADGVLAADGHLVVVDGAAIVDRIQTDAAHRRRGLGRVVMGALHAIARDAGVSRCLLAATRDGHALYTTLGWRVQSPYASAWLVD